MALKDRVTVSDKSGAMTIESVVTYFKKTLGVNNRTEKIINVTAAAFYSARLEVLMETKKCCNEHSRVDRDSKWVPHSSLQ
jgi:hypothetical protein